MIWLYAPIAPLTEALYSPWLVIHVVSRDHRDRRVHPRRHRLGALPPQGPAPARARPRLPRPRARRPPTWTGSPTGCTPSASRSGPSRCSSPARSGRTRPGARYWNWDPKEVWAFITWVVYAAYLHARATAGWQGRNAALLALLGLATLWFNFIGINFFSSTSQHSYAAPASTGVERSAVVVGPVEPA